MVQKLTLVSIGLLIVMIIAGLFLHVGMRVTGEYSEHAKQQAMSWSQNMYPNEISHISCQNADTDSNGYISCTIRIGERPPMAIECSVPMSLNEGCRIPPLQNLLQRQGQ